MQKIFEDYGIEIFTEDGRYYIRYDAGEIAIIYNTIEVSEEDAIRAQKSVYDADRVILENEYKD